MSNFTKICKYIKNNKLSFWQKVLTFHDMCVTENYHSNAFNEFLDSEVREMLLNGAELSWSTNKNLLLTAKGQESVELNNVFDCYGNFCTGVSYTNQTCSRLTKYLLRLKEKELKHLERLNKNKEETELIKRAVSRAASRAKRLNDNSVYGANVTPPRSSSNLPQRPPASLLDVPQTMLVLDLINTSSNASSDHGSSRGSSDSGSSSSSYD